MSSTDSDHDLVERLRVAQREHDLERRRSCRGVRPHQLDADNDSWDRLGRAIAVLARRIAGTCRDSHYGSARPRVEDLAARLAESIDDQVDAAAWAIIEASARRQIQVRR